MQNIVNEAKIARGARLGKIATFAGLGLLGGGLVVSLVMAESPLLWLSFAFLLVGLLVSSVGSMNMNRWVREPRADQALARGLKGFDDRYRLYHYYLPAPHVLLSPSGLFVFTAMGQDGKIRYEGDRFQRDFSVMRLLRFLAEEGMGKPFVEGDSQVEALREYLAENDLDGDIEIQNVVVFYNPRAELTVSSPPRPVANPKGLKKAIRKMGSQELSDDLYLQIGELFDENVDW